MFRSSVKPERNDELQHIEKQVDKYRDVLQIVTKKISTNAPSGQDQAAKEKRIKKINEYVLGQALEDSAKELPDGLMKRILEDCGKLEIYSPTRPSNRHKLPLITNFHDHLVDTQKLHNEIRYSSKITRELFFNALDTAINIFHEMILPTPRVRD